MATVARLEAEVAALRTALASTTAERDQYRHLYEQLREAYAKLAAGLRGQAAERLPADQRQLTLVGDRREARESRRDVAVVR
jgi:uncharacterized protein YukE